MRIYSMTATFGKLENETLTLEPGLNILSRPNEWGKSTWCAFLAAMLYGVETRVKSTKTALADKERYAPWSGSPMAGRIDLNWQGRDITIERSTKGRVPMGIFQAYEIHTGLAVAELTAENCGQQLLGVERSVFERAGFIRLTDMPVTQNDALRRQLNALVTTGDESGAAEILTTRLRELQNSCQSNRVRGRIPETQKELETVRATLAQMGTHHRGLADCNAQMRQTQDAIAELENHRQALEFAASRETSARLAQAEDAANALDAQLFQAEEACLHFPDLPTAKEQMQKVYALQSAWQQLHADIRALSLPPLQHTASGWCAGIEPDAAVEKAQADAAAYKTLQEKSHKKATPLLVLAIALALAAGATLLWQPWIASAAAAAALVCGTLYGVSCRKAAVASARLQQLCNYYGNQDTAAWLSTARDYRNTVLASRQAQEDYALSRRALEQRQQVLEDQTRQLCPDSSPEEQLQWHRHVIECLERSALLRRDAIQARQYAQDLRRLHKPALPPMAPDGLTLSPEETARTLQAQKDRLQQLRQQLGTHQGALHTLGDQGALENREKALQERLEKLELTYRALTLAQEKLAQATTELQRRFAPRISRETQQLFAQITGGRYQRLTLSDDLSLHTSTGEETALHSILWRSQGTADQLYLCLRLAVANALTPGTPLILDDALSHFDDTRMAAALDLLQQLSETRQVILFTCHSRENC